MMLHRHKCPKCGVVWQHGDECLGSNEAHTCPTYGCGTIEKWIYRGDEPASVIRDKDGIR
jgi:predicted  nucleic acid-binding Zn-ribbon protein